MKNKNNFHSIVITSYSENNMNFLHMDICNEKFMIIKLYQSQKLVFRRLSHKQTSFSFKRMERVDRL